MTGANGVQLLFEFGGCGSPTVASLPRRREEREAVVRLVEYAPCPRVSLGQERRVGFTRDCSASGLCLGAERPEPVGSLLRVVVRDMDGRPTLDSLVRVVWCRPGCDEGAWLGLSLVMEVHGRRALRVRPRSSTLQAEVA